MAIVPVSTNTDFQLDDFRGPWLRMGPTDVPPERSLLSLNAEYDPGQVRTRFGFGQFFNINKQVNSLYDWIKAPDLVSPKGNYLTLYNATDSKVQWIPDATNPSGSLHDLFSVSCEGMDAASGGNQLFIATFTSAATGAAQLRVVAIFGAGIFVTKAFMGPISTKPSLAEVGTGSVTAGKHFIGYVMTSSTGFQGPICPVNAFTGGVDTTSTITATGGKQIFAQVTAAWPADANGIDFVMAPVNNPFQYFIVPGTSLAVPGGSTATVGTIIDISDANLITTGIDISDNQNLLTQDINGNGPFLPFKVTEYGNRWVYLAYDSNGNCAAYISEPEHPQKLTETQHKRKLPGFRQMCSSFVVRGILYICGPNWTYSLEDNGLVPANWPSAITISQELGTPCVEGTAVHDQGDWAVVVHFTGLYIFDGQYADFPLTWMAADPDWRRINWNAAQTIRTTINSDKKQILVSVPLDGALSPNYIMKFFYGNGKTPEDVDYSLWSITDFQPRGMCMWNNPGTGRRELMLGCGNLGPLMRQMNLADDVSPWRDLPLTGPKPIQFSWECGPLPEGAIGALYGHIGGYVRAIGSGNLQGTSFALDHSTSVVWNQTIPLAVLSGQEYFRQFYITSERCSVRFTCGTNPGDFVILSGYRHNYYEWARRR